MWLATSMGPAIRKMQLASTPTRTNPRYVLPKQKLSAQLPKHMIEHSKRCYNRWWWWYGWSTCVVLATTRSGSLLTSSFGNLRLATQLLTATAPATDVRNAVWPTWWVFCSHVHRIAGIERRRAHHTHRRHLRGKRTGCKPHQFVQTFSAPWVCTVLTCGFQLGALPSTCLAQPCRSHSCNGSSLFQAVVPYLANLYLCHTRLRPPYQTFGNELKWSL